MNKAAQKVSSFFFLSISQSTTAGALSHIFYISNYREVEDTMHMIWYVLDR